MSALGGRIKKAGGRVKSGLVVLSVAGSLLAAPGMAAAKPGPPFPPGSGQHGQPVSGSSTGSGHKIK